MLPRILVLTLCCTLLSCKGLVEKYKRSNSGVSALDKKMLYDFRQPLRPAAVDAASLPQALKVLDHCNPPTQRIEGAFTYAAEQETAYLLRCGDQPRIYVFSGEKVQVSAETPYSAVAATFDLNRDDKNELLLTGESENKGEISREASLDTFEKGALRPAENFGIVYHDPCALFAGADEAKKKELVTQGLSPYVEAVVIYYLPRPGHEMASFTAERYRAACNTSTDWKLASPKSSGQ